ncbi:MAG: redox-sensitive transcriptional activator SoxR [Pseudomonadota bacterium]
MSAWLSIGELATRAGVATSAVRFYEARGLLAPERTDGGQRRFRRSDLRRLSFVLIAQRLGFSLAEIRSQLAHLPAARTPTAEDWAELSAGFRDVLDQRIEGLQLLRDRLQGCIGCGCLSLDHCALYNPDDVAHRNGAGPRYLLGDLPGVGRDNA